ncbi:MAG: DUF4397 domain-containing protein [Candidatus Zixiibacteriota bacterium]
MVKKKYYTAVMLLALTSLVMVGCSDDDNDNNPMGSPTPTSDVMIVHASPDAPGVDILVDSDIPAVEDLSFPTNTGYVELSSGTRNVKVNVANTTTTVIAANLNLDPNTYYSVFAIDSVSSIEPLVLVDNLTSPAAGKAHVRFVHLSPDAPAVDIAVANGGPVVFSNVAFREFEGFTPLDAGTYNLEVRVAGTMTVALALPGITLENGKIYTVFARGFLGGGGNQALGAEIIVNK